VFITGLNGPISATLFFLNPPDLANALPRVEDMESNQLRAALTKIQELHMTHTINLTTTIRAIICVNQ